MHHDTSNASLSWKTVETNIHNEMRWLDDAIDTFHRDARDTSNNPVCRRCLLRSIAIMIVLGDVGAQEIRRPHSSFWSASASPPPLSADTQRENGREIHHGARWHRETMMRIEEHFLSQGFRVEREPYLTYGRADLGVYQEHIPPLFVEVGTTSLYKICMNLEKMNNFVYLIVPADRRLVEFSKPPTRNNALTDA